MFLFFVSKNILSNGHTTRTNTTFEVAQRLVITDPHPKPKQEMFETPNSASQ